MKNYLKVLKMAAWALGALLGTLIVAFLVAFFYLQRSPVEVSSLLSHIPAVAKHSKMESLTLYWPRLDGPIYVQGRRVHIEGDFGTIDLPALKVDLKLHHLMEKRLIPRNLVLENPVVVVRPRQPADSTQEEINIEKTARLIFKNLIMIKDMSIHGAKVQILHNDQIHTIDFNGDLHKQEKMVQGNIALAYGTQLKIDCGLEINPGEKLITGHIAYTFADAEILETIGLLKPKQLVFSNALGNVSFTLNGNNDTPLQSLEFKGSVPKLVLDVTPILPQAIALGDPTMTLQIMEKDLSFSLSDVQFGGGNNWGSLTLNGQGKIKKNEIEVQTKSQITNLDMAHTALFWPTNAAPEARDWVTQNIFGGQAQAKADFDFEWEDNKKFQFKRLVGVINLDGGKLKYVDTMPVVENLKALARFDHEHFDVDVLGGTTLGIAVQKGKVMIGNFSQETTYLSLDVDATGELKNILDLINHPPLYFAKDFALNPAKTKGTVAANLYMKFPLIDPFDTSKIQTRVKAQSKGTNLKDMFNLPLNVTKADLNILVNDNQLEVKGKGLVNKGESTIHYIRGFNPKGTTYKDWAKVQLSMSSQTLLPFEVDLTPYWSGQDEGVVEFKNLWDGNGALSIKSTLKNSTLNALGYVKPKGQGADFELSLALKNYDMTALKSFHLTSGNSMNIKGKGSFDKNNNLSSLQIAPLKIGPTSLSLNLDKRSGINHIRLSGTTLDLKDFMERKGDDKDSKLPDFDFEIDLNRLKMGGPRDLLNIKGSASARNDTLSALDMRAQIEGLKENYQEVTASIAKKPDNYSKFKLTSLAGGALFEALNLAQNIRGGKLQVLAYHDDQAKKSSWEGKLELMDFGLLHAPFLGHVVSLIFPIGLTDLRSDGGLGFKYAKVRFVAHPDAYKILSARAYGNSLGITFKGEISRKNDEKLAIDGTVIPAYMLNSLVSKIPLIGSLLTGGKHEGLFATGFQVTGTVADPKTTMNPLSTLTPGFLRNIFSDAPDSGKKDLLDEESDDLEFEGAKADEDF